MNFHPDVTPLENNLFYFINALFFLYWAIVAYRTMVLWKRLDIPKLNPTNELAQVVLGHWIKRRRFWVSVMVGLSILHIVAFLLLATVIVFVPLTPIILAVFYGFVALSIFVSFLLTDSIKEFGSRREHILNLHRLMQVKTDN